ATVGMRALRLLATASRAAAEPYVSRGQLELAHVLPGPPAADSEAQKRELAVVLEAQGKRTPQQAERAVADNKSAPKRVADVLGLDVTKKKLSKTAALLKAVAADATAAIPKDAWNRQRPFAVSAEVKPIGKTPKTAAYPSAH